MGHEAHDCGGFGEWIVVSGDISRQLHRLLFSFGNNCDI